MTIEAIEVKLPTNFDDVSAIQDYFHVTESLARKMVKHRGWLRINETRAMKMMADPRFNGCKVREPGDVFDASRIAHTS